MSAFLWPNRHNNCTVVLYRPMREIAFIVWLNRKSGYDCFAGVAESVGPIFAKVRDSVATREETSLRVVESFSTGLSKAKFTSTASVLVKTEPIEEGFAVSQPVPQVQTPFVLFLNFIWLLSIVKPVAISIACRNPFTTELYFRLSNFDNLSFDVWFIYLCSYSCPSFHFRYFSNWLQLGSTCFCTFLASARL